MALFIAIVLLLGALALAIFEVRLSRELVTPLTLFLFLAITDIFLPGAAIIVRGGARLPVWVKPFSTDTTVSALLVYAVTLVLISVPYWFVLRRAARRRGDRPLPAISLNVPVAYVLLFLSGAGYFAYLSEEVARAGSVDAFLSARFHARWTPVAETYDSALEMIVRTATRESMWLFILVVVVMFYFRRRCGRTWLWGLVFPLVAWAFSLTTFFRGTQVALLLAFIIAEALRMRDEEGGGTWAPLRAVTERLSRTAARPFAMGLIVTAAVLFASYGTVRDYFVSREWHSAMSWDEASSAQADEFIAGHGLVDLAAILDWYPDRRDFFYGKTIIDMMLLPVPRIIYPSKPEWYGIDDITRGMGWPRFTQSAVTIPGELYANFGYLGLVGAPLYGLLFGFMFDRRISQRLRFVYACNMPAIVMVSHWMAFTGLVNALTTIPLQIVFLFVLVRSSPDRAALAHSPPAKGLPQPARSQLVRAHDAPPAQ